MSSGFTLLLLDCKNCGAPLAGEAEDVVFYCTACRSGFRYDPAAPGHLAPVEVGFVATPHRAADGYSPFWVLPARVEILDRDASGLTAAFSGLVNFFTGTDAAAEASGERHFVLPAFPLPIPEAVDLALRYTREFPALDELLGERLTGGVYGRSDARKLAEYVLLASEVEESDTLKDLDYVLETGEPRLLGVPWVGDRGLRRDAVFGLPMGRLAAGE